MYLIHRGYYTTVRRYEFYFLVTKTIFYKRAQRVSKILFCHSKIKFMSSSRRVILFLLYRQKDIDKNNNRGKVPKLRQIMENTCRPLGSRM